jgi:RND family efflux transporter MFP subunit
MKRTYLYSALRVFFKVGILSAAILSMNTAYGEPSTLAGKVHTVEIHAVQNWFLIEAKVEAVNQGTLSAQTSGRIQQVYFDVNDYVERGALLVQLRDKAQQATVQSALAQVQYAQAQNIDTHAKLMRSAPLLKKGSLSQSDFDSIKATAISQAATVKAAQALLAQAQEQLSYTQVRAPYAGIVKTRHVEVGESVSPGTAIMSGLSLSKLRAVADIPQRLISKMGDKSKFQIHHERLPQLVQSVTLFPYANEHSHSFKVRVQFSQEGQVKIFPGMWVTLNVPMGEKMVMTVPKSAVMLNGELSSVFVTSKFGAKVRQVRLGKHQNGHIEVLAGLRENEQVYRDGYGQLALSRPINAKTPNASTRHINGTQQ